MPRIFTRYRPAGTDPDGLVLPGSGFNGGSLPADFDDGTMQSDIGPSYQSRDDSAPPDMAYGDSTGPAAALDNPPPVEPSITKKSMRPAGKVPAIAAGPPPSAQASDPNGPPIPPEGLEGAPKPPTEAQQMLQETLRRYKSGQEAAPVAPGPASGIMGKIADVLVGMSRATPEEKMAMRHPIYAAQLQKYQSGMNNLLNGIKTYGTIAEEESKEQERQDNALTRRQGQQDRGQKIKDQARLTQQGQNEKLMTMAKDGATRVPSDTALTPEEQANGVMLMPDVFSDPKFSTRLDTHHGMMAVTDPEMAKNLKVPVGMVVPVANYMTAATDIFKTAHKPESAESNKLAFQAITTKLAGEGLSPDALTDVRKLSAAIKGSKTLTPEEKNQAMGYLATNSSPSAQGANTILRIEGAANAADTAAGNRADAATRSAAYKAYTPTLDSAERFNVMTKNYEDAIKNHDQQAMLSLLANHLGMTMGLQKGARLTKDIIQEAQHSRPWLQGLAAKFDGNGYLSGVTLTPEQMRQMVSLGRERFAEDLTKSRSEAKYMGATDDGPERTPNKATINFYIAQAGGDAAKAKQAAAADGWSIGSAK